MAADLFIRQLTEHLPADGAAAKLLRFIFDDNTGTVDDSPTAVAKQNTVGAVFDLVYALRGLIADSNLTMPTGKILGRTTASAGAIESITVGDGLELSAGEISAEVTTEILAAAIASIAYQYLPSIAVLTGGTSDAFDAVPTLALSAKAVRMLVIDSVKSEYMLLSGVSPGSGGGFIEPTDYNSSTNAKYWIRIS